MGIFIVCPCSLAYKQALQDFNINTFIELQAVVQSLCGNTKDKRVL